jgi:hypothetical protein
MRARILVVIFALVGSAVFARIGDTSRVCERRYGSPVRMNETGTLVTYKSGRLSIVIHFSGGVADMVSYHRLPPNADESAVPFAKAEIADLLEANGGGQTWAEAAATPDATVWRTEGGGLRAIFDVATNHLMVFTEAFGASG